MNDQGTTLADPLLDEWPHIRKSERIQAFQRLPREYMDDFFLSLEAKEQSELVLALPEGERRLFVRLLAPDEAADLIQSSPKREREHLTSRMGEKKKNE